MPGRSLHSVLRHSRNGFSAARQVVLGVACFVVIVYGALQITSAEPIFDASASEPDAPPATECTQSAESPSTAATEPARSVRLNPANG
jgi:hypothetical protein